MKKIPLFFLVFMLIGSSIDYTTNMFNILISLIFSLITIVVPMLLIYAFLRSTLDALKTRVTKIKPILPMIIVGATIDQVISAMMSLLFILLPFTIILLVWKAFIKLIKI